MLVSTGATLPALLAGCVGDDGDGASTGADDDSDGDSGTDNTDADTGGEASTEDTEPLVGVPVAMRGMGVELSDPPTVSEAVAAELDLAEHEVQAFPEEEVVEVYDGVSESSFAAALEAAGVTTDEVEVTTSVSLGTLETIRETIEARLEKTGVDASVTEDEGRSVLVFDGPDADPTVVEGLLEQQRVEVAVSYPAPDSDDPTVETVLTRADFETVESAQVGENQPSTVPVTLTADAADRFVTRLTENGFTSDGVGVCSFDPSDGEPIAGEYCVYTSIDDEFVYGASISPALANVIESGEFEEDPSFVLQTEDAETAKQLELVLKTGQLPTEIRLEPGE